MSLLELPYVLTDMELLERWAQLPGALDAVINVRWLLRC